MSAARPCHGYSGENFDQLRRDQKGQRQPARHAGREGDGKVGRPPPSPPPPQPPRKCKRTFLIRLMRRDLAAVRPPGCRAPRPTRPTDPPIPPPDSSDQIFSRPKLSFLRSFVSVHCSGIWRGASVEKKGESSSSSDRDEILGLFILSLQCHSSGGGGIHHDICTWGTGRAEGPAQCARAMATTALLHFWGRGKKGAGRRGN